MMFNIYRVSYRRTWRVGFGGGTIDKVETVASSDSATAREIVANAHQFDPRFKILSVTWVEIMSNTTKQKTTTFDLEIEVEEGYRTSLIDDTKHAIAKQEHVVSVVELAYDGTTRTSLNPVESTRIRGKAFQPPLPVIDDKWWRCAVVHMANRNHKDETDCSLCREIRYVLEHK